MYAVTATLPTELAGEVGLGVLPTDWRVLVFLLVSAVIATLLFGLAPALQSTRLDLVRSMRGEMTRDPRPWRAGKPSSPSRLAHRRCSWCVRVFMLRSAIGRRRH